MLHGSNDFTVGYRVNPIPELRVPVLVGGAKADCGPLTAKPILWH